MDKELKKILDAVNELNKTANTFNRGYQSTKRQINNIQSSIDRIEKKVDYIMNFLDEVLVGDSSDDDEDDDLEGEIYDTDESWAQDLNSWKKEYYDEDEDEDI